VQDYARALHWLEAASRQGHAGAQRELGTMLARGLGLPKGEGDPAAALKWLRLAADPPGRRSGDAELQV
jgi:TPR repeat protein